MSFWVNRLHSFASIPLPLNENSPQTDEFYGRQAIKQGNEGKGMSFLVNRLHSFAFIPLPLNENSLQPNRNATRTVLQCASTVSAISFA